MISYINKCVVYHESRVNPQSIFLSQRVHVSHLSHVTRVYSGKSVLSQYTRAPSHIEQYISNRAIYYTRAFHLYSVCTNIPLFHSIIHIEWAISADHRASSRRSNTCSITQTSGALTPLCARFLNKSQVRTRSARNTWLRESAQTVSRAGTPDRILSLRKSYIITAIGTQSLLIQQAVQEVTVFWRSRIFEDEAKTISRRDI